MLEHDPLACPLCVSKCAALAGKVDNLFRFGTVEIEALAVSPRIESGDKPQRGVLDHVFCPLIHCAILMLESLKNLDFWLSCEGVGRATSMRLRDAGDIPSACSARLSSSARLRATECNADTCIAFTFPFSSLNVATSAPAFATSV